jgi:hypothetical protein
MLTMIAGKTHVLSLKHQKAFITDHTGWFEAEKFLQTFFLLSSGHLFVSEEPPFCFILPILPTPYQAPGFIIPQLLLSAKLACLSCIFILFALEAYETSYDVKLMHYYAQLYFHLVWACGKRKDMERFFKKLLPCPSGEDEIQWDGTNVGAE